MRWFSFYSVDASGTRDLLARITCKSDADALDRMSASIWPGAVVFEGSRYVGTLPATDADERHIIPPAARVRGWG